MTSPTTTRFVDLAADVAAGAKDLVEAHGQELKAEVRAEVQRATSAAVAMAIGGVMALLGVTFLLVGLVFLLIERYGVYAPVAWGAMGLLLSLAGALTAWIALSQIQNVHLVPRRSLKSVRESLVWITRR